MAEQILQINFTYDATADEYRSLAADIAGAFADVEGLRWKIWTQNEEASVAGGVYLFENRAVLDAFLAGPLAAQVRDHPAVKEMSAKAFDVMNGPTRVTRGPV
jgi:hypothetical protein